MGTRFPLLTARVSFVDGQQGILQRGKLLMMLGQCADAVHDFERVIEYVVFAYFRL